jgi:hypothetical protein
MEHALSGSSSKRWCAVVVGGLLSSNCCALQLLLNYVGVGCAGFAVLSPFRLYFFLAAAAALLMMRTPAVRAISLSSQAALFFCLVVMPEVISVYSRYGNPAGNSYFSPSIVDAPAPSSSVLVRVMGMKCAACGDRARTMSSSVPCVEHSAVYWETGFMKLLVAADYHANECSQRVSAVLQRAGFDVLFVEHCGTARRHSNSNCSLFA